MYITKIMITGPLAKFFYIITFNNIKYKNYSDVLVLNLNLIYNMQKEEDNCNKDR